MNWKWNGAQTVEAHPMLDGRRVPIKSLMRRLDIDRYDSPAPLAPKALTTSRAVMPLANAIGRPVSR